MCPFCAALVYRIHTEGALFTGVNTKLVNWVKRSLYNLGLGFCFSFQTVFFFSFWENFLWNLYRHHYARLVNMWRSWKRLAYLYISNGHISNIHPNPHFPSKNCEQRKNYILSMRVSHTSNKSVVFYPSSMFRKRWNLNSGTFCQS